MSESSCSRVRELLPEHVRGAADPTEAAQVEAHLATCDACAAEAALLGALWTSRPEPPADLADRIRRALADDAETNPGSGGAGRRRAVPGWLVAAAALVVALGTGLFWHDVTQGGADVPLAAAALDPVAEEAWIEDAAVVVAGAPVLDQLEDDALLALLEEMEG